jgi:hypothetical protein
VGVLAGLGREQDLSVTAGNTYTITVGAGGAGAANASVAGGSGGDSFIAGAPITENPSGAGTNTLRAYGGGGGGSFAGNVAANSCKRCRMVGLVVAVLINDPVNTANGGAGNTPSTSPSQGNSGGNGGVYSSPFCGGGGGGATDPGTTGGNQELGMVVLAQHLLFLVQAHRPSTLVVVEAVLMGRPLAQEAQVAGAMVVLEQAQGREPQPLLVGLQIPAVEVVEVAIGSKRICPRSKRRLWHRNYQIHNRIIWIQKFTDSTALTQPCTYFALVLSGKSLTQS